MIIWVSIWSAKIIDAKVHGTHAQDSISRQLGTSDHRPVGVLAEIHEEAKFPVLLKTITIVAGLLSIPRTKNVTVHAFLSQAQVFRYT